MSDQNITEQHVKAHYQRKNLSNEKLQQLVDIARMPNKNLVEDGRERVNWKQRWKLQRNISIAASLLLVTVILFQWSATPQTQQQLIASIAQEIVINHQKQFDIEFPETNYSDLSVLMRKLDFKLVDPERLKAEGFQILGGRYCSLRGHIAAQVRLKNSDGEIFTLYQTNAHDTLKNLTEHSKSVSGINVEIWKESGVFLGIAG